MEVNTIWKVPAQKTKEFCQAMRGKGIKQDSPATLLNHFAGYNFFYETDESFGDITEETALRISNKEDVEIKEY